MTNPPIPKISDARNLSKRYGLKRCIILFEVEGGFLGYASWGKNKQECAAAKEDADAAFEAVERRY